RVAALAEGVDRDPLSAQGGVPGHADGLLEAGHSAGLRDGAVRIEDRDGAERAQVEVEARVVGGVVQPPGPQWLDDLRVEPGGGDLVARRGLARLDAALGAHRDRRAAVEEDREAARAVVGEAEARDA